MKNLILVLYIISFFSCVNTKNNNSKQSSQTIMKQDTTMSYEKLAKQKLNFTQKTEETEGSIEKKAEEQFECIENTDKTFVLCKKTLDGTVMQPRNSIQFVVYDTKTNETVYEGSVSGGSVEWYDTNRVAVYQSQGNPMQGTTIDDMTLVYDLINKTQKQKSDIKK